MATRIAFEAELLPEGVVRGGREAADALRKIGDEAGAAGKKGSEGFDLAGASMLQLTRRAKEVAIQIADLQAKMEATKRGGGVISPEQIQQLNRLNTELDTTKRRIIEVGNAQEAASNGAQNFAGKISSLGGALNALSESGNKSHRAIGNVGIVSLAAVAGLQAAASAARDGGQALGTLWGEADRFAVGSAGFTEVLRKMVFELKSFKEAADEVGLAQNKVSTDAIKLEAAQRLVSRGILDSTLAGRDLIDAYDRLQVSSGRVSAGAMNLKTVFGEIQNTAVPSIRQTDDALGNLVATIDGKFKRSFVEGEKAIIGNSDVIRALEGHYRSLGGSAPPELQKLIEQLNKLEAKSKSAFERFRNEQTQTLETLKGFRDELNKALAGDEEGPFARSRNDRLDQFARDNAKALLEMEKAARSTEAGLKSLTAEERIAIGMAKGYLEAKRQLTDEYRKEQLDIGKSAAALGMYGVAQKNTTTGTIAMRDQFGLSVVKLDHLDRALTGASERFGFASGSVYQVSKAMLDLSDKTGLSIEQLEKLAEEYRRNAEAKTALDSAIASGRPVWENQIRDIDATIAAYDRLQAGGDRFQAAEQGNYKQRAQQQQDAQQQARNLQLVTEITGQSLNNVGKQLTELATNADGTIGPIVKTMMEWRFPDGDHIAEQLKELTAQEWKLWEAVVKTADAFGPSLLSKNMEAFAKLFREGTIDAEQFRAELEKLFMSPAMLEGSKATGAEISKLMQLFFGLKEPVQGARTAVDDFFQTLANRDPFETVFGNLQRVGDEAERMAGRVSDGARTVAKAFENMRSSSSQTATQLQQDAATIGGALGPDGGRGTTGAGPTRQTLQNITYQLGRTL